MVSSGLVRCVADVGGKRGWGRLDVEIRNPDTMRFADVIHHLQAKRLIMKYHPPLLPAVFLFCLVLCMSCASYSCTVVFVGLVLPATVGHAYASQALIRGAGKGREKAKTRKKQAIINVVNEEQQHPKRREEREKSQNRGAEAKTP